MMRPDHRFLTWMFLAVLFVVPGCESSNDNGSGSGGSDAITTGDGSSGSGGSDANATGDGSSGSGGGPSIVCGDGTCTGGKICCLETPPKCIAPTESCAFGYGSTVSCDGPEDCDAGQQCMDKPGSFPMSVACVAGTDPYSAYCHDQKDCGGSSFDVQCCAFNAGPGLKRCNMKSMCPAE